MHTRSKTLETPTNDYHVLEREVRELFAVLLREVGDLRRAGVRIERFSGHGGPALAHRVHELKVVQMPKPMESKEELASRFARYSDSESQFRKAIDAAFGGCVKKHTFLPSGRCVYTVVGRNAEEFIDPDKSFCSCESYFYGVLSNKVRYCYHILSYRIAEESGLIQEVRFDDEEYDTFMRLLASDVLHSRELGKR